MLRQKERRLDSCVLATLPIGVKREKGCYRCGLRHHVSICEKLCQSIHQGRSAVTKDGDALNPRAASFQAPTTSMFIGSKGSVLLQTARANISRSVNGQCFVSARMMFDSSSQRSYISENLQKTLNLPFTGQETLLIKTFGESNAKRRGCDMVHMAVETVDSMQIYDSAHVVPVICTPISNQIN